MNNKGQSRSQSMVEASFNTISGMAIAFIVSQIAHILAPDIREYIWSGFTWNVSFGSNIIMTIILTGVSICRSYYWRRYFNTKLVNNRRK